MLTGLQLMSCPISKSFRVSTGHEKSDSLVDLFPGGTKGLCGYPT